MAVGVRFAAKSRRYWTSKSWSAKSAQRSASSQFESNFKVSNLALDSAGERAFVRPGFRWDTADAYLFDIDGTLLNSRDPVHYFAFHSELQSVFGTQSKIHNVPVQGNTDIGILRAVLRRDGLPDNEIDARIPEMVEWMCREVQRNADQMRPEICPSIVELLSKLRQEGKLLGAASGNLESIGWMKLQAAGLKDMFSFGSFCYPLELRPEIFARGVAVARQRCGDQASVFVVGDTPSDIHAAKAANIPVIAMATGIHSFTELVSLEPDACFGCAADLLNLR